MTSVAKMRSALHTALERIGHRNSHACPSGDSNIDPLLHELFVAHEGWSHFDKRRKSAILEATMAAGQAEVDSVSPGTEQSVVEGEHYSLVIKKNNASERVDKTKINNALHRRGFTEVEVVKFMSEITTATKPATSVRAVPKA